MKPDLNKIEDAVLALLFLTSFTEGRHEFAVTRAWKGHDWDALDRLHQKGLLADPKNKNKSVVFTDAGYKRAEALFHRMFCESNDPQTMPTPKRSDVARDGGLMN